MTKLFFLLAMPAPIHRIRLDDLITIFKTLQAVKVDIKLKINKRFLVVNINSFNPNLAQPVPVIFYSMKGSIFGYFLYFYDRDKA